MPNKFSLSLKLMRITSPTGYLLLFFPASFGLLLTDMSMYDLLRTLPLFFIGSVLIRSSGCIINDIFDRDFDKQVLRTQDRPLANGSLNIQDALILLIILLFCSLLILLSLSNTAIYLGFFAFIMLILYPLMKRVTNLAQVFLGFTFNLGTLIGYATILDRLSVAAFCLYIACCTWTIGYDTLYGFMDLNDDKKIQVKSMAILLENSNYKLYLYGFYLNFIVLFIFANIIAGHLLNYVTILLASLLLIWQIFTLKIDDAQNCFIRFKNNNYVAIILLCSMLT